MLKQFFDIPQIMRRHSIEPAVFVLSIDENGKANGMAAGWNMKCSYDPPMLVVALKQTNNTQRLIQTSKEFVVAVPSPELHENLEYFGSVSGSEVDKFASSGIKTTPSVELKTPLLADARVNFECKLVNTVEAGDHYLFIGEVVATHYNPEKEQLYFAGRDPQGNRIFQSVKTQFSQDIDQ